MAIDIAAAAVSLRADEYLSPASKEPRRGDALPAWCVMFKWPNGWWWCAPLAALVWLAAVLGFGAMLPGYSQWLHPVAVLGAEGIPRAVWFDLFGFVVPGMLCAVVGVELRLRLPAKAPWPQRIGAQLTFLSSLGFVAMGVVHLDPQHLQGTQTQLHATAWVLWWATCLAAALLLGVGLRGQVQWRGLVRVSPGLALLVVALAVVLPGVMPAGLAQRLSILTWFGWCAWVGLSAQRRSNVAILES